MNLKLIKEDSKYLWALCPNHDDVNTPNLCINKTEINGRPKGYGYCYACGYRIDVDPKMVDKMSKKKTLCRKPRPIDWESLVNEYWLNPQAPGKLLSLAKKWKIKPLQLTFARLGFDGEAITIPMYNEDCDIIGIHRRFKDGSRCCVDGSQLGLFLWSGGITQVVITEGFSDGAIAKELGFYPIGKPCASFGELLIAKFVKINKIGKVVTIQDNDSAGEKSAKKVKKALTSVCECGIIRPGEYKDLKEYYLENGKKKTIKLLKGE